MVEESPSALIGCLLDVSYSMRNALEAGRSDKKAVERFRAVLSAALKLAKVEQQREPRALMFVGAFGLSDTRYCIVDLCGVVEALVGESAADTRNGHRLLIQLANQHKQEHIADYIKTKFTDGEARVLHAYLSRHDERTQEFVNAIPPPNRISTLKNTRHAGTGTAAATAGALAIACSGPFAILTAPVAIATAGYLANKGGKSMEEDAVEKSEAIQLARQICKDWLLDYTELKPRPVGDVVHLLQKLEARYKSEDEARARNSESKSDTILDTMRKYMYGGTPMRKALQLSLDVFRKHTSPERQVLLLVSDGLSTDGDPQSFADQLKREKVTMATVYLTEAREAPPRELYDRADGSWGEGPRKLFAMAGRIAGATHPIPVFASMGWKVPSSGECALFAVVSSATALDEFCSMLLSARFGSADALLNTVGRFKLDRFVNDAYIRTCNDPSDQERTSACYAHATAAVVHMALLRIERRDGGCPSIETIRERILQEFPPGESGQPTELVLKEACKWYRPLRFQVVDEDSARQAVLRRRPVLATYCLSKSGWDTFCHFFSETGTSQGILSRAQMQRFRSQPDGGGHAVVLVGCDPRSLTFLNSWGNQWGNNGSFSVEDSTTLGIDASERKSRMRFYDVFWVEGDLTDDERRAYQRKVDRDVRSQASKYPGIFEIESCCPLCSCNSSIVEFRGNIRQAICPKCNRTFTPEPGHLAQALYARAGLSFTV